MEVTSRKIVRPMATSKAAAKPVAAPVARKAGPAESTNAENFYYAKQIQQKTPMVVVLRDNEEIRGTIEWYDKTCIKLDREAGGVAMIYKSSIKFMYKDE